MTWGVPIRGKRLDNVTIGFRLTPQQKGAEASLVAEQQDPFSKSFHKWLSPDEYAARFGASPADRARVTTWLTSQGFTVTRTARAGTHVFFSGTVGQIERAFHTEMHEYEHAGVRSFGLSVAPSVPTELASSIVSLRGTHSFRPAIKPKTLIPVELDGHAPNPDYTNGTRHALSPDDFATIYNVKPLYAAAAPIDGTGSTIAVVGRTMITASDVTNFRSRFGLPAATVNEVLVPGTGAATDLGQSEYIEASLDVQWSGAIAKGANVVFAYVGDAVNNDNIFTAMQYILDERLGDVATMSFGGCEADFAGTEDEWIQFGDQAAVEGISVLASSGDAGAATCDQGGAIPATNGLTVSLPAAAPGITAVGGTGFSDAPVATYWGTTNNAVGGSALSYIPETAWNDCDPTAATPCTSQYASTGGGASQLFVKPYWQTGPGVLADGKRDVPDISLEAGSHVPALVRLSADGVPSAGLYGVSGTSVASPTFASVLGVVNQALVARGKVPRTGLGNVNPILYALAANVPAAFHDITVGNNKVPCTPGTPDCTVSGVMGYSAATGYDLTTGLGTFDVSALVNAWSALEPTSITLDAAPSSQTAGQPVKLTANVASTSNANTLTGTVEFFDQRGRALGKNTLAGSAGSGTTSLTLSTLPRGIDHILAYYSGDKNFINSFTLAAVTSFDLDAGCDDAGNCDTLIGTTDQDGGITVVITDVDAGTDAGPAQDAGTDAGPGLDAGTDAGPGLDAGTDAGPGLDAGTDAGPGDDAGNDGGSVTDGGGGSDGGGADAGSDAGPKSDAGAHNDGGTGPHDSGTAPQDSGAAQDSGGGGGGGVTDSGTADASDAGGSDGGAGGGGDDGGCSCHVGPSSGGAGNLVTPGLVGLALLGMRRRRRAKR